MLFSNLKLHLTTTRSSTFSGFQLALLGVTTLPATEKTHSDLDEAAATGKTPLTSLAKGELSLVMLPPFHLVHGRQLIRQQLERLRSSLCGAPWTYSPPPPPPPPPSPCPRTPSCGMLEEGFSRLWGRLANLDDQGWTWYYEYLLASDYLWASPLVGLYLHRRHFAMAPSILGPKYL